MILQKFTPVFFFRKNLQSTQLLKLHSLSTLTLMSEKDGLSLGFKLKLYKKEDQNIRNNNFLIE